LENQLRKAKEAKKIYETLAEQRLKEQIEKKTEEIERLLKEIDEARELNEIQDKKNKRLESRLEDEMK
jgi:hypothetical protein